MKGPFSGMYDDDDDLDEFEEDFEEMSSEEDLEEPGTRRGRAETLEWHEHHHRVVEALEWVIKAADTLFEVVEDDLGSPDVDAWIELRDAVKFAKSALQEDDDL